MVSGMISWYGYRLTPSPKRQAQETSGGDGFICGRCGVAWESAAGSSKWVPSVVERKIYSIALMAAREIGNDSAARNTTYKCPEDEKAPCAMLSLRGRYGEV